MRRLFVAVSVLTSLSVLLLAGCGADPGGHGSDAGGPIADAGAIVADAGSEPDAGVDPDAGMDLDAGMAPDGGTTVSFAADVQPIFNARCTSCHRSTNASGDLVLTSAEAYAGLVSVSAVSPNCSDLDRVAPGDPSSSLLYLKITGMQGTCGGRMPPTGNALSSAQIETIRQWIAGGAPNN